MRCIPVTAEPGPGVDAQGRPVIDPTANVIAILEAAVKRQDDLREKEAVYAERVSLMRAAHAAELRVAESARINAIREVDVAARIRSEEVAAAQAELLRVQVENTRAQSQVALAAEIDPLKKDIADLRRSQYEGVGQKTQVTEGRSGNQAVITAVVAVFAFLSLLIGGYAVLHTPKSTTPSITVVVPTPTSTG